MNTLVELPVLAREQSATFLPDNRQNTARSSPPSTEMCTKKEVLAFQLPLLVARLKEKLDLTDADAMALFEDTKKFLYLCGINPDGRWGPTIKIDAGWHEFLMFTKEYREFCHKYFGRFIDHTPNDPDKPRDGQKPRRTLQLAMQTFGALSPNWVYTDKNGSPVLGPHNAHDMNIVNMSSPCDSCGCSPCD